MDNILVNNQSSNIPLVDKEKLLKLSYGDKLRYIDQLRISYPRMNDILLKIEECQQSSNYAQRPKCLSIIGPSGSGKTTFCEIHSQKYPKIETREGTEIPILYSKIPCPARIGGLAPKLLYDMGDSFYSKRSVISLQTQRLYDLIKACKVKLIFLDEVQHLVDRNSDRLIRDSSDWFKELIDATRIPVVFMGMLDSKKIFIENEQLANRVRMCEEVGPFKYSDSTYRKLLHLFDHHLPFKNLSGFAQLDMSNRIYLATKGLMKHMRDLIVESANIAVENNLTSVTMPVIAQAYEKILCNSFETNPFLPGFEMDRAIEKYLI